MCSVRILLQSVSIQQLAVSLMQQRPGQRSGREQGAMNGERREREREGQARRNILLCHIGNGLLQMTSSGAPVNGRGRKCSGPGDHLPVVTQSLCHPQSWRNKARSLER